MSADHQFEWQPIATAPKNGDEILVCTLYKDGSSRLEIGYWDGEWRGEELGIDATTHWMPLPDPPK